MKIVRMVDFFVKENLKERRKMILVMLFGITGFMLVVYGLFLIGIILV